MDEQDEQFVDRTRMTLTIIVCAMAAGILTFSVVTIFLRSGKEPSEGIFHFLALGVGAAAIVGSCIVPGIIGKNASSQGGVRGLAGIFQTKTIIACALIEGAAFFNLVAYLIEGHKVSLFTGAACIALVLVQIPTKYRLTNWIQQRI